MVAPVKKDPAFLLYATAWLQSQTVRAMGPAARGHFIDLLCYSWLDGSIPADHEKLRTILGLSKREFSIVWERLGSAWVPSASDPSRLVNQRQEHEREERRRFAEDKRLRGQAGGKRSAEQRASGRQAEGQAEWQAEGQADHQAEGQAQGKPSISISSERVRERESPLAREAEPEAEPERSAASGSRRPKVTLAALESRRGLPGIDPPSSAEVAAMQRALEQHRIYPQSPAMRAALARALAAEGEHPDNLAAYAAEVGGSNAAQRGARLCGLLTDPERLRDTNSRVCREAHEGKP